MTTSADPRPVSDCGTQKGRSKVIGYCRVSTDEQTTALQVDAMARAGITFQSEAASGAAARPVLASVLAELASGDTLVVWRLDRLGRSLRDLLTIATDLRERGIGLRSLTEGFDTSTTSGRLLYAVLGAVAEFERETLRERTVAGMRAAQRRGEHVGRPLALAGSRLAEARRMLEDGRTCSDVARVLRVSRATVRRARR